MARTRPSRSAIFLSIGALVLAVLIGFTLHRQSRSASGDGSFHELRILAYASFTSSWGPGPVLADMFEEKMKRRGRDVRVVLLQAEDAGLLLAKMAAFPADIVLGFDQLGRRLARQNKTWKPHGVYEPKFSDVSFLAFDWAPLGFVYREGEVEPPRDLDDLLSERFRDSIALQDPRSSSPGFQFLNWLVRVKGGDEAFKYLATLRPNIQSMSGSWSQAYGLFTRGLAKLTFSYATSILYHQLSEKDERYRFAKFPIAHPVQAEYAAISDACRSCELAEEFLEFLVEDEAQTVIMNKNWMLPVNARAAKGTPFEKLSQEFESTAVGTVKLGDMDSAMLLKKWAEVGL